MADDNGAFSAVESLLGDRYTREARLAPAFLSLFPVLIVLIISFKGLREIVPAILSLLCVFGVVRWISHIARGIGDKREIKLFRGWGGKPTTTMLRVATGHTVIEEFHLGSQVAHLLGEAPPGKRIEGVIEDRKGPDLPTAGVVETANKIPDPRIRADKLDCLYEPVVAWMRENSRESVLVIEEEISYGFQRNFFSLKYFALACGVLSFFVEVKASHLSPQMSWPFIAPIPTPIVAVILVALFAYVLCVLLFVTNNSVKVQGFIYARALLDSFYATVATLGLLSHTRYLDLPPSLHLLSNWGIIAAALILFGINFFVDKVPALDLVWNALHTFIRIPVAALLAFQATAGLTPAEQLAATLAGGAIAFIAHGGKTALRAAVTPSPEPFSNIALSLSEDGLAIFLTWLSTWKPYIAAAIAFIFILVTLILIRFAFRALRSLRRRRKSAAQTKSAIHS